MKKWRLIFLTPAVLVLRKLLLKREGQFHDKASKFAIRCFIVVKRSVFGGSKIEKDSIGYFTELSTTSTLTFIVPLPKAVYPLPLILYKY